MECIIFQSVELQIARLTTLLICFLKKNDYFTHFFIFVSGIVHKTMCRKANSHPISKIFEVGCAELNWSNLCRSQFGICWWWRRLLWVFLKLFTYFGLPQLSAPTPPCSIFFFFNCTIDSLVLFKTSSLVQILYF